MKKLGLLMIFVLLATGTVFAQRGGRGSMQGCGEAPRRNAPHAWCAERWAAPPQEANISGTLQLQQGLIAVVSGSDTYFAPSLRRHVGFIQGLTEGAQVSMEGFLMAENFFFPTTLTIGGRTLSLVSDTVRDFTPGERRLGDSRGRQGQWGRQDRNARCW